MDKESLQIQMLLSSDANFINKYFYQSKGLCNEKTRMTTSIKRSSETVGQTNIATCRVSELND